MYFALFHVHTYICTYINDMYRHVRMYVSECTLGFYTVTEEKPDAYQAERGQSSVFIVSLTFTVGEANDPSGINAHT